MEILRQNRDAMFALQGYRAECYTVLTYDDGGRPRKFEVATLTAQKPNKMRYDSWWSASTPKDLAAIRSSVVPDITFACDGNRMLKQFGDHYRGDLRTQPKATAPEAVFTILEPWHGFYSKKNSLHESIAEIRAEGRTAEVERGGTAMCEGVMCDKVLVHKNVIFRETAHEYHETYYIGQSDHLVRRCVQHVTFDGISGYTRDATIRNIELNPKVKASVYSYSPPPTVKLMPPLKDDLPLLPNGRIAPDFSALDANRKPIKLSNFRGKVVVIDFWASWCGPCRASMPHTQEVIKRLSDSGVQVVALAIDDGEPRAAFDAWVSDNQSKYPNLSFAHIDPKEGVSSKLFNVSGIPTQYVVDGDGVIRASFVGYGGPTDDLERAIRAASGS
ncbi:MAG: peroxiredoxin family protein [Fimbriimonadales bacterium]